MNSDLPDFQNIETLTMMIHGFVRLFVLLVVVSLIAMVAVIIALIKMTRAKQNEKESAEYASYIIKAQEDERTRISAELHDTVAQDLRAVLSLYENDCTDPLIKKTLASCISEIRQMCYSLVPPDFAGQSLSGMLKSLCLNFREKLNLELTFFLGSGVEKLLDSPALSELQKLSIYRIVQESLTNIHKHAGDCEVSVFARREYKNERMGVYIFIEDDGRGFDYTEHSSSESSKKSDNTPHFGLQGMKMRSIQAGFTLTVKSEPESGTKILLFLPLGAFSK